ncbi:flippase [Daejeonella oryzae]|uniref:flippase n=1 Tax=Daejeonella oryzae TaxID=1122943 RepID=UPI0003FA585F|nr:flippase [Daejeonella oryzae]
MKIPAITGFDPQAFEKYFKNTAWLMLGRILSMIVGFIIARYLGPSSFGDLSFAMAFTGLFAAVATLGLDSFIIREIIHTPEKRDLILGTSFWMRLMVSLLLIPLSVVLYVFFRELSPVQGISLTALISLCAFASAFKSFNVIDSYFQSQVKSKYIVHIQNICLFISAAIKVSLILLKLPVVYFALALVIDGFMLAAGFIIIYQKKSSQHIYNWKFSWEMAAALLKKSWPLIFTAVMISIYMQIDLVMLKSLGAEVVGIYSAAARISEAWYFIPVAIITSVMPAIIQARKSDVDRYTKRLQNLYDLLVAISLPVALIVSLSANFIINLLYGDQFEGAGLMLSIHIWSGVFVFLGSASSQYLLAEGYTIISFKRTALGAVVNILLNLWLIPLYGGVGSAIATLIAYFTATFSILLFPHTRRQGLMMLKSLFLISLIQKIYKR